MACFILHAQDLTIQHLQYLTTQAYNEGLKSAIYIPTSKIQQYDAMHNSFASRRTSAL